MGTALFEVIPGHLLDPERKDDVIAFLARIPAPPERIKQVYLEWCQYVGIAMTREDLERILGEKVRYI